MHITVLHALFTQYLFWEANSIRIVPRPRSPFIIERRSIINRLFVVTEPWPLTTMMLTSEEVDLTSLRPLAAQSGRVTDLSSDPPSNSVIIVPTPSLTPPLKLEWGPIEHLAYFSCDEARKVTFDLSCLHAFRQPALPANLAWGRKLFLKKNRRNRDVGHPKPLVDLAHACIALGKEEELRSADVVTWRGLLVK